MQRPAPKLREKYFQRRQSMERKEAKRGGKRVKGVKIMRK
jgi:hypothetical protein